MNTMKLLKRIQPDFSFADERGVLVQLSHENVAQVNAVFTKTKGEYMMISIKRFKYFRNSI